MSPSRFSQAANSSSSCYKPVPPPKPFAGIHILAAAHHQQQQHQQQQQQQQQQQLHQMEGNDSGHHMLHNGHAAPYPHILVTEQGQFVTHSTKFPIGDDSEKLVKVFNEANSSLSHGIDNPALITESSLALGNQSQQHKETTPNHYAQMRPYDPSKHPAPFMANGHQQTFNRPSLVHSYHHQLETTWQNHAQTNSVRFALPPVNQSTDKKPFMNGNSINNQNSQRQFYPSSQPSILPQHPPQHCVVARDNGYEPVKNPHYQETKNASPNDSYISAIATSHSMANGTASTNRYGNGYILSNGDLNTHNSSNQNGNGVSTITDDNNKDENRKDDKWGSLKRAGKKYSQFKNILSNKLIKPEPKSSSAGTSTDPLTQSQGTNSQIPPKNTPTEPNGNILNHERLHNGENHQQENRNFQRVVQYSSLKTRLEGPPQQTYDPSMFMNSERQSGREVRNHNGNFQPNCSYGNHIPNAGKHSGVLGPKRAGSCSHLGAPSSEHIHPPPTWGILHRSDDNLTRPLASDQSYPEHNATKTKEGANVHFLSTREGRISGSSDSGRGTGGGSATEFKGHDTSLESGSSNRNPLHGHSSGNESEWIDIPDTEGHQSSYRGILHNGEKYPAGSRTPPLPPLSPEASPKMGKRTSSKPKKSSNSFSVRGTSKPDILETTEQNGTKKSFQVQNLDNANQSNINRQGNSNTQTTKAGWKDRNPNANTVSAIRAGRELTANLSQIRLNEPPPMRGRENEWRNYDSGKHFDDDDVTSTEGALDLNSVLDGATEATSDDELGSTRDGDAYVIRRQLEGLEGMYSEVLKVIGGRRTTRHADPRLSRRRTHGSISSLPSSIMSSRAPRDRKGKVIDDRLRRTTKDVSKTTHKRFQRLESHVVTLARSVAHLSSEMRTQHLMLQEMENIRSDLSALKVSSKSTPAPHARGGAFRGSRLWNGVGVGSPWSNPGRVKKLTQFFGDEPPLVRIFLKKLGYEKYAPVFEQEKIGMLELPYMTEDRLQKIGIPLGPRLRILEEAQGPITTDGNLSVYVV